MTNPWKVFNVGNISLMGLSLSILGQSYAFEVKKDSKAGAWEKVKVEGVECGNGQEYKVFIRKGDSNKLAVGFSGGGACWSASTCFGMVPLTSLKPTENFNGDEGIFSTNQNQSLVATFTHIYFPYCTGDVFLGNHQTTYDGKKVNHKGRVLVENSIKFLREKNIVNLNQLEELVIFGFSAGAIGALYHATTLEEQLGPISKKTIISDSPGMHFGKDFWKKFPKELITDYQYSLEKIGLKLNIDDGNVAQDFGNYCQQFSTWKIGVIQSTKDFVMTTVFGNISANDHKEKILGPSGLYAAVSVDEQDNCTAWIPDSTKHVYLMSNSDSRSSIEGKTSLNFANDVIRELDHAGRSYRNKNSIK
jgi:hypothetical protein